MGINNMKTRRKIKWMLDKDRSGIEKKTQKENEE